MRLEVALKTLRQSPSAPLRKKLRGVQRLRLASDLPTRLNNLVSAQKHVTRLQAAMDMQHNGPDLPKPLVNFGKNPIHHKDPLYELGYIT